MAIPWRRALCAPSQPHDIPALDTIVAVFGVTARRPDPVRTLIEFDQLGTEECVEPRALQAGVEGRLRLVLFDEDGLGESAPGVLSFRKIHLQAELAANVNPYSPDGVSSSQENLGGPQTIEYFKAPRMDDQGTRIGGPLLRFVDQMKRDSRLGESTGQSRSGWAGSDDQYIRSDLFHL